MSALDYLFSLETFGIKLGLENIRTLLADLDRPDRAFHSIVIAGTNGKGSVTAMVERGLRAAGWRTGRYTSPHLVALNERFALDGEPIRDAALLEGARAVQAAAMRMTPPPTFFEATTALACDVFRRAGVDAGVMEVGLGGRLDATNALEPVATAITAIDFDHQDLLGSTIAQIAGEKAGIIKPGIPVVVSPNPADARAVIEAAAASKRAPVTHAAEGVSVEHTFTDGRLRLTLETPRARYGPLTLGLRGRHQLANALTAVRLLEVIDDTTALGVGTTAIESALRDVEWPGRLQLIAWRSAQVLVDAAHNPSGARALAAYIAEVHGAVPFVFAAMGDKDIDGILEPLAPVMTSAIVTRPGTHRAAPLDRLEAAVRRAAPSIDVRAVPSPADAIALAATPGATVAVAGSLYLAGAVLATLS